MASPVPGHSFGLTASFHEVELGLFNKEEASVGAPRLANVFQDGYTAYGTKIGRKVSTSIRVGVGTKKTAEERRCLIIILLLDDDSWGGETIVNWSFNDLSLDFPPEGGKQGRREEVILLPVGIMGGVISSETVKETSLHEFRVQDATGKDVDLGVYRGKVLLVVNVASKCGFTDKNYTEMTDLYNRYRGKDFEILAFPCNQFLRQEPGSSENAKEFACTRYKAEYPIFQKVRVNGANAAPVYKFLKTSKSSIFGSGIKWNFTKFLVDKEGKVISRYGPTTSPFQIENDIKKALGDRS
ncbi:hypothetical protein H6P81_001918 [Aristolochia fimbriata]|uniref:Glutathione peroxidase n=1 Tax=Aristolochia fimbriata TaxID=158543 RepID=A0AAV7F883_ARIFI|nr:hypothetical protein H6P81_001918 [Aristolochia fimbriata]